MVSDWWISDWYDFNGFIKCIMWLVSIYCFIAGLTVLFQTSLPALPVISLQTKGWLFIPPLQ